MIRGLKASPRRRLFRAVCTILGRDPTLRAVFGDRWQVHSGREGETDDLIADAGPSVRLTPSDEGADWYSPDSMVGTLVVEVEYVTPGTGLDDAMDLWGAIEDAVIPHVQAEWLKVRAFLVDNAAESGVVTFRAPSYNPRTLTVDDDEILQVDTRGQIRINYRDQR